MNEPEITRIGAEDAAEQGEHIPAGAMVPEGGGAMPDLSEEFAETLDLLAKAGGMILPTIPMRFTHAANVDISQAAIKLCAKYGYDARKFLIGENSVMGAWLGLGFAVAIPGMAVFGDWKALQAHRAAEAAKLVDGERVTDGSENASSGQQSGQ